MSTAAAEPAPASPGIDRAPSLQDVVGGLGGIPLSRILARPAPGRATEDDLLDVNESRSRICELVDGTLVAKTMGFAESLLAMMLGHLLLNYVIPNDIGLVTGPDAAMKLGPGLVRVPDVAFFVWEGLPGRRIPAARLPEVAPALAVEVLSKGNTKGEMERKRREYFDAGVRLVWLVDPKERRIVSYKRDDDGPSTYGEDAIIEGIDFLPGFSLSVRELFGPLDQKAQEEE
ncbi:hypothetical protein OJF2_23140 [Aquisphaera giovannonii]|uniref:Putative restriction endonuclease domain-containing protein n=1 Tax=Aquisphaera giovannonii TaxID=406548 RepID=A0A5B9W1A9_9BACT|nr:Uma2 family endonuclease [Aquisphaera giovannonii]QEH33785.1 hypothetical protein OJF2_23140 [Aquisphaera giovannonii]